MNKEIVHIARDGADALSALIGYINNTDKPIERIKITFKGDINILILTKEQNKNEKL